MFYMYIWGKNVTKHVCSNMAAWDLFRFVKKKIIERKNIRLSVYFHLFLTKLILPLVEVLNTAIFDKNVSFVSLLSVNCSIKSLYKMLHILHA